MHGKAAAVLAAAALAALAGCGGGGARHATRPASGPGGSSTTASAAPATSPSTSAASTGSAPRSTAAPTTAVPTTARGGGGPLATVAPKPVATLAPVAHGQVARYPSGVSVRVVRAQQVTVTAQLPGDVAGPAVAVVLQLTNGGTSPFPANGVSVNATYGAGVPASPVLDGPSYQPFTGTLAPGANQTGTYPFHVPAGQEGSVVVAVDYHAGQPTALLHV